MRRIFGASFGGRSPEPSADATAEQPRLLADLQPLFARREFWTDYCWLTEENRRYPELAECRLWLPIADALGLVLALDASLGEMSLYPRDARPGPPVPLAWDDRAHWHPHLFRWEELEAACRCLARREPAFPHPGVPLLLLYRFLALSADDDSTAVRQAFATAWRGLGLFTPAEVQELTEQERIWVHDALPWARDPARGWVLPNTWAVETPEVYSLRRADNDAFPFERFNALIEEARRGAVA